MATKTKTTGKAAKATTKTATKSAAKTGSKKAVASATASSVKEVAKKAKKARTKSDILGILSQTSGLTKKEVNVVFENLYQLINLDLGKSGPGVFNLTGLMKIVRVKKPATKQRKGINPFTKEPMTYKAKPARNVVKVRALKTLKAMAESN